MTDLLITSPRIDAAAHALVLKGGGAGFYAGEPGAIAWQALILDPLRDELQNAIATEIAHRAALDAPAHNEYPHEPGRLYDCEACESRCHCTPGTAQCIYDGEHHA